MPLIQFGEPVVKTKIKREKPNKKSEQLELMLGRGYIKPIAIELCPECKARFTQGAYYIADIYRQICEKDRDRFKDYMDTSGDILMGGIVKPIKEIK